MAERPADALIVVERSLRTPLSHHTFPAGEAPAVLLLSDGVHLALREPVSPADLDGVVALGASLAGALSHPRP